MRSVEGSGHVDGNVGGLVGGHRAISTQDVGQASAFDVLHHDEWSPFVFALIKDAHDVLMVKARNDLGLATEAPYKLFILGQRGAEDLHRNRPVEQLISGKEYVSCTTGSEPSMQLVAAGKYLVGVIRHSR